MRRSLALLLLLLTGSLVPQAARADGPQDAFSQWQQKSARKFAAAVAPLDPTEQINPSPAIRRNLLNRSSRKAAAHPSPGALLARPQNRVVSLDAAHARYRKSVEWQITWNELNGTPAFISGTALGAAAKRAAGVAAADIAHSFITEHRAVFGLENPPHELQAHPVRRDALGHEHLVFKRRHQGIPLWGHDLAVHFDARGELHAVNARYAPTLPPIDSTPTVSADQAIVIAAADLSTHTPIATLVAWAQQIMDYDGPQTASYIWIDETTQQPHLIWHIQIRPNLRDRWYYFVDAHSGTILESYNAVHSNGPATATALDLNGTLQNIHVYEQDGDFVLIDASRPIFNSFQPNLVNKPRGAVWTLDAQENDLRSGSLSNVTSTNNTWSDPVAVSAHLNTGIVFDYFFNVHNRRGIDDSGGSMISVVHVTERGRPMDNAFWNGALMAYGDGDALFDPLPGALDVAAHEMTHGVIERTVPLEYRFQSGALNESFADVFAAMVDRQDWQIGEDIVKTNATPAGALRNMANPHNGASTRAAFWQPDHMDEFVALTINQDNGGVHINSGIPNRACFLIADVIGRDKTEQIYYRILDARYLNTRASFADLRLAALRAATDLFGDNSPEGDAIVTAFDTVGILGAAPTEAPGDIMPVDGEEWIVVVRPTSFGQGLFLARPKINSDEDVVLLTTTPVRTQTGNTISVSDDGALILFIDSRDFIRSINSDGSQEAVISPSGEWFSLSLSPDGRRLAATRTVRDSTIYIFALGKFHTSKAIRLYNPTTQEGVRTEVTLFADAMDWDLDSQFVLYDAFNSIPQASGDAIEFWNVNMLDVENELILPVFPALPEGVSIGNPSFAHTNDNFFAFDLVDFAQNRVEIWTADLFKGTSNRIGANGSTISFPKYSPDDSQLIFQRQENDGDYTVRRVALGDDKISVTGSSEEYLRQAQLPTWFTIGSRPEESPTDVEDYTDEALPTAYRLQQNYPNPFNAETVLHYSLPYDGEVELAIYDLLGRRVRTLESGFKTAGEYVMKWNGVDEKGRSVASGVYFYRLQASAPNGTRIHKSGKMTLLQ